MLKEENEKKKEKNKTEEKEKTKWKNDVTRIALLPRKSKEKVELGRNKPLVTCVRVLPSYSCSCCVTSRDRRTGRSDSIT